MKITRSEHYICDVCGKEIEAETIPYVWRRRKVVYKFKKYFNGTPFVEHMCEKCFEKFKEFVKEGADNG